MKHLVAAAFIIALAIACGWLFIRICEAVAHVMEFDH